jgi:hypothetical protein
MSFILLKLGVGKPFLLTLNVWIFIWGLTCLFYFIFNRFCNLDDWLIILKVCQLFDSVISNHFSFALVFLIALEWMYQRLAFFKFLQFLACFEWYFLERRRKLILVWHPSNKQYFARNFRMLPAHCTLYVYFEKFFSGNSAVFTFYFYFIFL